MTYISIVERDDGLDPIVIEFESQQEGITFAQRLNETTEELWPADWHNYVRYPVRPLTPDEFEALVEQEATEDGLA